MADRNRGDGKIRHVLHLLFQSAGAVLAGSAVAGAESAAASASPATGEFGLLVALATDGTSIAPAPEAAEPAAEPAADAGASTEDAALFPLLPASLPGDGESVADSEPAAAGIIGGAMIPGYGPLRPLIADETAQRTAEPSDPRGGGIVPPSGETAANDVRAGQRGVAEAAQSAGNVGVRDVRMQQEAGVSPLEAAPRSNSSVPFTAAGTPAAGRDDRPPAQAISAAAAITGAEQPAPVMAAGAPHDGPEPASAESARRQPVLDPAREGDSAHAEASRSAAASLASAFLMGDLGQQRPPPGDVTVAAASSPTAASVEAEGDRLRQSSGMAVAPASDLTGRQAPDAPGRAAAMPGQADSTLPPRQPLPVAEKAVPFEAGARGTTLSRAGLVGLDGSNRPPAPHPVEASPTLPADIGTELAASPEKPKAAASGAGADVRQLGAVRGPEGQPASRPVSAQDALPAVVDVQALAVSAEPPDPSDAILPATMQRSGAAGIPLVSADPEAPALHRPTPDAASVREVPVSIAKAMADGKTEVTLALRPPELGHLTIRLHFADGQLQVDVRADRPETLHLLQREAEGFERSLRQAGLDVRDGGLQFSAHGDGSRQRPGNGASQVWHGLAGEGSDDTAGQAAGRSPAPDAAVRAALGPLPFAGADRLDLRI